MVPEYTDDVSIGNDEVLYRRVKLKVDLINFDPATKKLRPTSTAFKNTVKALDLPDGAEPGSEPERVETYMSVFMNTRLTELGLTADRVLEGVEDFVLVRLTAGQIRDRGNARNSAQQVFHAPEPPPPPCMEAHGGAAGKKTKGLRNDLSDLAIWVITPSRDWVLENREILRIPADFSVESDFETLFA